jgi:hypothetical protein
MMLGCCQPYYTLGWPLAGNAPARTLNEQHSHAAGTYFQQDLGSHHSKAYNQATAVGR